MTAAAINPATSVLPGLTGAGSGQAVGPLAGFEALLAALFGETDIAGVPAGGTVPTPAQAIATAPAAGAMFVSFEDAAELPEDAAPAEPNPPEAGQPDSNAAAPDALLVALNAPAPAPAASPAETTAAPPATASSPAPAAQVAPPTGGVEAAPSEPAASNAPVTAALSAPKPATTTAAQPPVAAPTPATAATAPQTPPPTAALNPQAGTSAPVLPDAPQPTEDAAALPTPEVMTEAGAREEITKAADAPPQMSPSKKEKDKKGSVSERSAKAEDAKAEPLNARGGATTDPTASPTGKGDAAAKAPKIDTPQPEARKADLPEALEQPQTAETKATTQASQAAAPQAHPVRGAPETVANLAAQIVKKLEARSTRFDLELDPVGLGKVDVRVEIGAHGRMTASLSFENPQAAAELRTRSGELHKALEQAGFDLSGGLSFDVAGDRGQARQDWGEGQQQGGFRGRAFQQAMDAANEADLAAASGELRLRRGVTAGVDVRI
ncbi:flagellar hook-length control protein FliK [Phenylobacterium sp. VNQ135]|uniref:flagellar hook-length control protein FliK n=1 Tax=Phenylobacterium sp. VNQ135 TaxID=3400922 RepID=UPI003C0515C5